MATPPSETREGLILVGAAGATQVAEVAQSAGPAPMNTLMEAVPSIVDFYLNGSAELALEWYDELRSESTARSLFTPSPVTPLRVDVLQDAVGWAIRETARETERLTRALEDETARMLARLTPIVEREISAGFWDTITENSKDDPDSAGWQRFARPEACPFCLMLADKGAVYKSHTADFAAHTNCKCVVAPVFGDASTGEEVGVMQYLGANRERTDADRKALRDYLKKNYGA